ncbi:MAG: DUF86 domain-containing protein [Candidatus Omnitrophica bacterium]|nr:DUF86 domain-containing protein [Candidatus Omnitrophota bacterium]
MAQFDKIQRESIIRRVDFVITELKVLDDFKDFTYQNYLNKSSDRKILERTVENIVNAIIDISKIILVVENIEIPTSYSDAIKKLSILKILDEYDAKILSGFVHLRNILAHEYLDLNWVEIKKFIENKHIILRFITKVENLLQN